MDDQQARAEEVVRAELVRSGMPGRPNALARQIVEALAALPVTPEQPTQASEHRAVVGEAMARFEEYDYCHERVREWEALEQWEKDAYPYEEPYTDREDSEWWNARADVAISTLAALVSSPSVETVTPDRETIIRDELDLLMPDAVRDIPSGFRE